MVVDPARPMVAGGGQMFRVFWSSSKFPWIMVRFRVSARIARLLDRLRQRGVSEMYEKCSVHAVAAIRRIIGPPTCLQTDRVRLFTRLLEQCKSGWLDAQLRRRRQISRSLLISGRSYRGLKCGGGGRGAKPLARDIVKVTRRRFTCSVGTCLTYGSSFWEKVCSESARNHNRHSCCHILLRCPRLLALLFRIKSVFSIHWILGRSP